jgi:hypothetical protein
MPDKPLINITVQLEKYPGKGGWTYAILPPIPKDNSKPFGLKRVKGFIDDYEIRQYHLFTIKEGNRTFLPVKAAIRKKIKKEEGDWITVVLYADHSSIDVPKDFRLCLEDDPEALSNFNQFSESEQKKYIDWIYAVKTDDLRIQRMAEAIHSIAAGKKL